MTDPRVRSADWSIDDGIAAQAEGWDVFYTGLGPPDYHDVWEISRIDFPDEGGGPTDGFCHYCEGAITPVYDAGELDGWRGEDGDLRCPEKRYPDGRVSRLHHVARSVFSDPDKMEGGASEHVFHRALGGSVLHAKALAFLLANDCRREVLRIFGILNDAKDYP